MTTSTSNPTRLALLLLVLLISASLTGCGGDDQTSQSAGDQNTTETEPKLTADQEALVKQAAAMADAISDVPESLTKILADNQMTNKQFKAMIYRISADPVLSRAYKLARK
ncbi:MAG: hypothetical protein QNL91_14535 [Candidatus Krumholzibacteria bacterium]|nr:hypothetical protein [Candidatus Krumholzibacteria bacterium]